MHVVVSSDDGEHSASDGEHSVDEGERERDHGAAEALLRDELAQIDAEMARLRRRRQAVVARLARARRHAEAEAAAARAAQHAQQAGRDAAARERYASATFAWTERVRRVLRQTFGHAAFRGMQEAVVNATMDGRDCVAVMPTGGGKSLCYQVPALAAPGLTLVVSPLIALMDDQVLHLRAAGVSADAFTSESRNAVEVRARLRALVEPPAKKRRVGDAADPADPADADALRVLYVAPEKLVASKQFVGLVARVHAAGRLARIVVDECHCASEYGSDFRPDYGRLALLRHSFPGVPLLALSATCPPRVLANVVRTLAIDPLVFTAPLWRPNLRFSVIAKPDAAQGIADAAAWVLRSSARGIVYCATRADAHDVVDALRAAGVAAGLYYGALDRTHKQALHAAWRARSLRVVVATSAFGMGIDAPDVAFVLHVTAPKTLESYYQEAGRAGRDGSPAECVLMYRPADSARLVAWGYDAQASSGLARARAVIRYAESRSVCRKLLLLAHLQSDEDMSPCAVCDVCTRHPNGPAAPVAVDCSAVALSLINVIHAEPRMTLARLIKHMRSTPGRSVPPTIAPLLAQDCVRLVPAMSADTLAYIINSLTDRHVLADVCVQTAYTTNAYIAVSEHYLQYAAIPIDDAPAAGFEPIHLDFPSVDLPVAGLDA